MRADRADELKALAERTDRSLSWWIAAAVDGLLRSDLARAPDTAP